MGDLDNLGGAIGGFLGGTGGQLLGAGLSIDELNKITDIANRSAAGQELIGREAQEASAFKPFTVSTGFGGVQTTPEGGFTTSLSPAQVAQQQQLQAITSGLLGGMGGVGVDYARQPGDPGYVTGGPVSLPPMRPFQTSMSPEQAMASRSLGAQPSQAPMAPSTGGFGTGIPDVSGITTQALGGVTGALTGLMSPMATREADVYERIRATQRPEEERRQLALQDQLLSQGRLGLRTAQFGGSPEQFALAQAQEEAKNRAALSALGQAQAEQQQQLGLAQGLFGLGSGAAALPASLQQGQLGNIGAALGLQYAPEQQLLSSLDPAVNLANIVGTGQRQGAGYLSSAGISGLEDILQAETVRSQNLRDIYSSLLGAQTAQQQAAGTAATNTGLFGSIGDIASAIGGFFN
tara:strand:+ start:295 stop:1515 length:1221 start_codon:yes stop_codon:yes gene_type:complete